MELTQKGNRYLNSKGVAYAQLRDQLAGKMVEEWPEMEVAVRRVLDGKGAGVNGIEGLIAGGNATRMEVRGATAEVDGEVEKKDGTLGR